MKRVHITIAFGGALIAATLAAVTVHLLGAPEWAPWLTLLLAFPAFSVGFLIIVEAVAEEAPHPADAVEAESTGLEFLAERRTFNPQPHYEANPPELFAGLINDDTVVYDRARLGLLDRQQPGSHRVGEPR